MMKNPEKFNLALTPDLKSYVIGGRMTGASISVKGEINVFAVCGCLAGV